MSLKRNKHLIMRKAMTGLLTMAMVVTAAAPAGSTIYAAALEESAASTVLEQDMGTAPEDAALEESAAEAVNLTEDNVPQIDIQQGNRLPLTGYLNQNITVGDETRTVK